MHELHRLMATVSSASDFRFSSNLLNYELTFQCYVVLLWLVMVQLLGPWMSLRIGIKIISCSVMCLTSTYGESKAHVIRFYM